MQRLAGIPTPALRSRYAVRLGRAANACTVSSLRTRASIAWGAILLTNQPPIHDFSECLRTSDASKLEAEAQTAVHCDWPWQALVSPFPTLRGKSHED